MSKWDQKAYNKFTKKNIIHAIGFDQQSRSAHVVNLYVFPNNVVSDDYPIQTVGYSWNILDFSFILTSYIETHKREDNTFIAALKTFAYKKGLQTYLSLFEKSFYNSCDFIGMIDKFSTDELGIYYHCIDYTNFVLFLKKYKYKEEFIDVIRYNKDRFDSYSFEIAINYMIKDGRIVNIRTAFYGVF